VFFFNRFEPAALVGVHEVAMWEAREEGRKGQRIIVRHLYLSGIWLGVDPRTDTPEERYVNCVPNI